jgi:hypothetical protein
MLAAQNWFSYQRKGGQEDHVRKLTKNVNAAPVELRAVLAQTTITLNDLLALQPGDVITTEKQVDQDVLLQVEGRGKFLAQVGEFRGSKAVRITRMCQDAAAAVSAANAPAAAAASGPAPGAAAAVGAGAKGPDAAKSGGAPKATEAAGKGARAGDRR